MSNVERSLLIFFIEETYFLLLANWFTFTTILAVLDMDFELNDVMFPFIPQHCHFQHLLKTDGGTDLGALIMESAFSLKSWNSFGVTELKLEVEEGSNAMENEHFQTETIIIDFQWLFYDTRSHFFFTTSTSSWDSLKNIIFCWISNVTWSGYLFSFILQNQNDMK